MPMPSAKAGSLHPWAARQLASSSAHFGPQLLHSVNQRVGGGICTAAAHHDTPNHDIPNHDTPYHDIPNHDIPNHDLPNHSTLFPKTLSRALGLRHACDGGGARAQVHSGAALGSRNTLDQRSASAPPRF
eukprot:139712-Rhodomonas_salina.2